MSIKKIKILQVIRFMVQVGFLILLPGLFAQVFGELKMVVTALLDGSFQFYEMLPDLLELAIIIPLTIVFGRFFCGWICAFGTYNDIVYKLFGKTTKKIFKRSPLADKWLKSMKYILLVAIVGGIWVLGITYPDSANPWSAFGMLSSFYTSFPTMIIGFGILAVITVGAAFVERFFCRYLCPLGGIFAILSKLRVTSLEKPTAQCGSCKVCTNSCAMGIDMNKKEKIDSGECIFCMKCVENCPRKNVRVNMFGRKVNAKFASTAAIIGFIGMYASSSILVDAAMPATDGSVTDTGDSTATRSTASATSATTSTNITSTAKVSAKYKDGTYTGTGVGYRPGTQVSVTIKDDKITSISVLSTRDDRKFYRRAFDTVISRIISNQKTSVQTVSGATYSSKAIINAVKNALTKAAI